VGALVRSVCCMTQAVEHSTPQSADVPSNPADIYEQWFVPAMFNPMASRLLDAIRLETGTRALDVACGTGIVARRLAAAYGRNGSVTGLDLSPAMIAVARAAAERESLNLEWHVGRLETLPFADSSFDLVTCQQGLQFAVDREAAVRNLYRVLTPGGRAAICVWQSLEQHPVYVLLHTAMQRVLNTQAMATPFSLPGAELERLLNGAGFVDVVITPVTITASFDQPERYVEFQIEALSAGIPLLQQLDAGERAKLVAGVSGDMEEVVRELTIENRLQFPMYAYLAQARRPTS
jgi:SAM-dependent methyltransferase